MTRTRKTTSSTYLDSAPPTTLEEREVQAIVAAFPAVLPHDRSPIYRLLDAQLTVLHGRAQSLMQLAGVVITVTGFSGRIIADTSKEAQTLIVTGVALVSAAACLALGFVMPIRWVSSYMHLPVEQWVLVTLRRRERKSRAIRVATAVLVIGMVCYIAAIAMMLVHPGSCRAKARPLMPTADEERLQTRRKRLRTFMLFTWVVGLGFCTVGIISMVSTYVQLLNDVQSIGADPTGETPKNAWCLYAGIPFLALATGLRVYLKTRRI